MNRHLALAACLAFLFAAPAAGQIHDRRALDADPSSATGPIAPRLAGLGSHSRKVTTSVPASQAFFDQGLRLAYAFNHSEALRAFKEAARLDPDNAMAYWGWALVLGPNLNLPMTEEAARHAYPAVQAAMARRQHASPRERAYIEALAQRYAAAPEVERAGLDRAYAAAMRALHEADPSDADAATLYAAALMNQSPWDYWSIDGRPHPRTTALLAALEGVMARDATHPGALHYYIHAVEAAHPERGIAAADALRPLMPSAGHMVHMPSHIYMRVGRYADAYDVNALASRADESYIAQCRAQGIYPLNYYPHNLHFLVWAAMLDGRSQAAIAASRRIEAKVPRDLAGNVWAAHETFLAQPLYALVRFGRWSQILAEPEPPANARFLRAVWHYARGLAFAHEGKKRDAKRELKRLRKLRTSLPADYAIGYASGPILSEIAIEVLASELAAREGEDREARARLERAVRLQDGLPYNEPPDWYFPVRHYLGALLLEQGHPAEAEVVYWEDLRRNRGNGFALFGLRRSLEAQGKSRAAADIGERFRAAWTRSDVVLGSSRY